MVTSITTTEAQAHLGKSVSMQGWIQSIKELGSVGFLTLRDGQGAIQAVVESSALIEELKNLTAEVPVRLTGVLVESPNSNGNSVKVELKLHELKALSRSRTALPVELHKTKKMRDLTLNTMLEYRPLTLRSDEARHVFRLEAEICRAFREFLNGQNFVEIHSPKIVSTGTEGGARLFRLDYFGREAFLAQSPQFYKQIMVGVFERVFEIGPVYRAEEHDTTRHLNEYLSMDLEMGFIESEGDIIALQVKLLKHVLSHLKEYCQPQFAHFGAKIPTIETIPTIGFAEALELLVTKLGWQSSESTDLDPQGEKLLYEHFLKSEGSEFVYVTGFPLSARPFYTMPGQSSTSRGFDLLFRGLEITTGGQRIHEYQDLVEALTKKGMNPESFTDYLQAFRFGMPPHGGLAIGLERLAKQLLNLPTVKLASLFPRDRNRLSP